MINTDLTNEQWRYINYLNFKMQCLADQEDCRPVVDVELVNRSLQALQAELGPLIKNLKEVMPKVPIYSTKTKPKVTHKKDGSLSANGEKWFSLLKANKLPMTFNGEIKIIKEYEEPNPGSSKQVKDWLFSLGWEPCTFKYTRNKETGEEKAVEQVRYSSPSHPRKGELTDSVLQLKDKEPNIELLEKITVIEHRLSVFKGFIDNLLPDNSVSSGAGGFTNTLRLKHRAPIANLPKVDKPWGAEIRGSLVSPEGHSFLGSDMVSLESTTKRHYMFPYDPEYVEEMSKPGFDEHVNLASFAGVITKDEERFYVWYQEKNS